MRDIVFKVPLAARLLNIGLGIVMIIILFVSIGGDSIRTRPRD